MKRLCKICGKILPIENFPIYNKNKKGELKRRYNCRLCWNKLHNSYARARREKNPEPDRQRCRNWWAANRDKACSSLRIRRRAHPDKVKKARRKDYLKHKEAILARMKAYYVEHPEIIKARTKTRWAIQKGDLRPTPCCICGNQEVECHHKDYSKPFDVAWLCGQHHKDLHQGVISVP